MEEKNENSNGETNENSNSTGNNEIGVGEIRVSNKRPASFFANLAANFLKSSKSITLSALDNAIGVAVEAATTLALSEIAEVEKVQTDLVDVRVESNLSKAYGVHARRGKGGRGGFASSNDMLTNNMSHLEIIVRRSKAYENFLKERQNMKSGKEGNDDGSTSDGLFSDAETIAAATASYEKYLKNKEKNIQKSTTSTSESEVKSVMKESENETSKSQDLNKDVRKV
eukprot:g1805.t1